MNCCYPASHEIHFKFTPTFHHTYHYDLQAVPHSAIAGLMAVFRRLPQRVVIKLDSEYWREATPANVMVMNNNHILLKMKIINN